MSHPHPENHEHERLLADAIAGDLLSEADRRRLEDCDECRDRLAELQGVLARLDRAGAFEREELARSEEHPSARDAGWVHAIIAEEERRASEAGLRPGAPSFRWTDLLGLAALLLVGLAILRVAPRETEEPRPPILLGKTIEVVQPVGTVQDYARFAWRARLPVGGWFEVLVFAPGDADVEIVRSGALTAPRWEPETRSHERWPDAVRWEVRSFDATGAESGLGRATARRIP